MRIQQVKGVIGLPAAIGVLLAGCAQLDMAQNAYGAVRAGYGAKSAYESVKSVKDAEPVFSGYNAVVAFAELQGREGPQPEATQTAFAENLRYLVSEHSRIFSAPLQACVSVQSCGGRVLAVQFREDAYNGNFAERISMGNRLKGRLVFVDLATGKIVAEKRVEGVDSYAAALGVVRGAIAGAMFKSYPQLQPKQDALDAIPAVKPGYEKLFASA